MNSIPTKQVQTLLLSGMGKLPGTCLGIFKITHPSRARKHLTKITQEYTPLGLRVPEETFVFQLAFTAAGLKELGIEVSEANGFDRAFCEGMTTDFRQRVLGDLDHNAPDKWAWSDREAHLLIWVYGETGSEAEKELTKALQSKRGNGLEKLHLLTTDRLPEIREHFGFRDGISNPRLPRAGQIDPDQDGSGDFLFGFKDATGEIATGPVIHQKPFGEFGSYLVLRQISQDVPGFWKQWMKAAHGDTDKAIWLASKAVGRWPNGMPIQSSDPEPMPDLIESKVKPMDFRGDEQGMKCPFGAHIRRSNPQDEADTGAIPKHRIFRRGRVYGPICEPDVYPDGLTIEANHLSPSTDADRGILFACLNTDIERQFEFVQQTWINNPKFRGLHQEIDPITGGTTKGMKADVFTIPSKPFRHRVTAVQPHVRIRGGGYFFLPGKPALEQLFKA